MLLACNTYWDLESILYLDVFGDWPRLLPAGDYNTGLWIPQGM